MRQHLQKVRSDELDDLFPTLKFNYPKIVRKEVERCLSPPE